MVWSPLQQLNVDTVERQEALQADRDYQEVTFLKLVKRGYQKQQREGRHAAVEQPKNARSWVTPVLGNTNLHCHGRFSLDLSSMSVRGDLA